MKFYHLFFIKIAFGKSPVSVIAPYSPCGFLSPGTATSYFFLKRIFHLILHQSSRFSLQVLAEADCGLSATIGASFHRLSLYLAFLYTLLSEFKERFLSIVPDAAKPNIWNSVNKFFTKKKIL